VDIFDASTGIRTTATLSVARGNINAIAAGGKIYFAGGLTSVSTGALSNRVDIYDVANNSWSTANLSQARRSIAIATIGNKIYFAGGERSFSQNLPSNVVDIYDFVNNVWTTDTLSVPHDALIGVSVANKVMFAGGGSYSTNNYCDVVDIFTDNTIGFSEFNSSPEFTLYPNPANDIITFSESVNDVEVFDVYGNRIIAEIKSMQIISVRELADGIYFVRSGNSMTKFIVQH
jgi:hypothetical protein